MVCRDMSLDSKKFSGYYHNTLKSISEPSSQSGWKMKMITTYITPSTSGPLLKGPAIPQQKLTKEELDEKGG